VSALEFDRAALVFVRTHGHSRPVEHAVAAYSRLGEHGACWIALALGGAALTSDTGRRRVWLHGAQTVVASYFLNQAVKFVIRRRRPELPGLPPLTPTVTRLSFPSAHATTSFAAAGALHGLLPVPALYIPALLFALSRPYLGVHYPSDVVAGAALGTAVAKVCPLPPACPP
jgi:membrane-associated phospholipid phosphatase